MKTGQHNSLYVILARGGSKRLPRKNLLTFGGVSLVGRAIKCAQASAYRLSNPHKIVVSTDSEEIASEARQLRAEVPFLRDAELANDEATSIDALRNVVDWYASHGESFSEIILLQPTSPLRITRDVVTCIENFRAGHNESSVTVTTSPTSPVGLQFAFDEGRLTKPAVKQHFGDKDTTVALNGAAYVCSPDWIKLHDSLCIAGQTVATPMPKERSIDVDTHADMASAESLHASNTPWTQDRCFVIAEAGVNHNGCLDTAHKLIDKAALAGADAIKFQTYTANRLTTRTAPKAEYQKHFESGNESQHDMLQRLELSPDDHRELMAHCARQNIRFLSSAFSNEDVDLLDELDVFAIKLGSAEITNFPLLSHAASTLRPIILSTGCSSLDEVQAAVRILKGNGCSDLALLHCVSAYPARCKDANLRAMKTIRKATKLPVGFSDHTEGILLAAPAVAMSAKIIEKHFTLDRSAPGPDHRASLEPDDLRAMIESIRMVESALGDGIKRPRDAEANTREIARRSLVAVEPLEAGTILQPQHLIARRPGTAISPTELERVLGRILAKPLISDELLTWNHLSPAEVTK